jgi:hypothetical protein
MRKKITLSIEEKTYRKLHILLPPRKISQFFEEAVNEKVKKLKLEDDLEKGFQRMAKDREREKEAVEWSEAGINEDT